MNGSGYISSGSYGCVNDPPIKCEDDEDKSRSYYKNTVGKYFNKVSTAESEFELNRIVKMIDPNHEWTLPLYKKCVIKDFQKKDQTDRCEHFNTQTSNITTYIQLIYKYGGLDLYSVIDKYSNAKIENKQSEFIKIFNSLGPILKGLHKLNEKKLGHFDIKPGNILYNGNKLSIIDFGLMINTTSIFRSENEKYLLFNYQYYPPEFKLYGIWLNRNRKQPSYNTFMELFKKSISTNTNRFNLENNLEHQLSRFYSIVAYNTDKFSKSKKVNQEFFNFKDKIDIYSLGITLLELYDSLIYKETHYILLIKKLIENMINLNPYERINWDNLIKEYELIVESEKIFSKRPIEKKKLKDTKK
jgi:serine/threonine protein kinase